MYVCIWALDISVFIFLYAHRNHVCLVASCTFSTLFHLSCIHPFLHTYTYLHACVNTPTAGRNPSAPPSPPPSSTLPPRDPPPPSSITASTPTPAHAPPPAAPMLTRTQAPARTAPTPSKPSVAKNKAASDSWDLDAGACSLCVSEWHVVCT